MTDELWTVDLLCRDDCLLTDLLDSEICLGHGDSTPLRIADKWQTSSWTAWRLTDDLVLIEMTHALSGRPVWLAAWIQDKEFISVLSAHRQAMRMLPRLALVLHVADISEADPLRQRLESMDLRCVNWDDGGTIEDTTQVILSSEPEDLGLWQRVSAVTFMGSSLERGAGGQDPLTATALGSAIIHGPFVHRHQQLYDQLDRASAARTVRSATELGDAVVALLAPDRAADMALAGWQIVTEGAPQADHLIDIVQDCLDQRS